MTDTYEQPLWARLIDERRQQMRPRLSARKAAEAAGLSEGRWRQIVKGYQSAGGGKIPVVGPAETVARMAQVVGLSSDELAAAGRPDAAEEMRRASSAYPERPDFAQDILDWQSMWAELQAFMNANDDEWPDNPPTRALQLWSTEQLLEALAERVKWSTEAHKKSTRDLIVRQAAIDSLRHRLGLSPRYPNTASSRFNTTDAVVAAGGLAEGGDGDDEDAGRSAAPMNADDYGLAAHDEEHDIEDEQGHDEHP